VGSASKRKGTREERDVAARLRDAGLTASRTPLSGALGGDLTGDVRVRLAGRDRRAEVKVRRTGHGFKTLYAWLAQGRAELLVVRMDHAEPLVCLPWPLFLEMAGAAVAPGNPPSDFPTPAVDNPPEPPADLPAAA
jgi:hypothetical protein